LGWRSLVFTLVPNSAARCFETDAGYSVEVSRKLDILVAPQSVLEPLALTKARKAIRNSPKLSAHSLSSAQEAPRTLTTAQTQSAFVGRAPALRQPICLA
jgi:hypothetical protein